MNGVLAANRKRMAAIIYLCFALNGMLSVSVGALLPYLLEYREISYEQSGGIGTVAIAVLINLACIVRLCTLAVKPNSRKNSPER